MEMNATIGATGVVDLEVGGTPMQETYPDVPQARRAVLATARGLAAETGEDTRLRIQDPSGSRTLVVDAGGTQSETVTAIPAAVVPATAAPVAVPVVVGEGQEEENAPAEDDGQQVPGPLQAGSSLVRGDRSDTAHTEDISPAPVGRSETTVTAPSTSTPSETADSLADWIIEGEGERGAEPVTSRRESLPSFVDRPEVEAPATCGWRGVMNLMGLRLGPAAAEREQRADEAAVAAHWAGPRTVAVLNPKGGAGKTPTVICLAAVFARLSGGGVLAWDNNNSLGSLGWRSFDAGHAATVVDLLDHTEDFMRADARVGDLSGYVHHQPADRYDVLRSDDRSGEQERHMVTGAEVDRLHAVAAKYYRLIVMDSGNTERGGNWQAMINHTDQVVIPVKSVDDAAEGASRVLDALRAGDEHGRALVAHAVVVILCCEPGHYKKKAPQLAKLFAPHVRSVTVVPYDPALVEGRVRFSALSPATRRAWLRAGAEVREGL